MKKQTLVRICEIVNLADMGILVTQKGKKALTLDQLMYIHAELRKLVEEKLEKGDKTKLISILMAGAMLENYIEKKLRKKCKNCPLKDICTKYNQGRGKIAVEQVNPIEAIQRLEKILRSTTGVPESALEEAKPQPSSSEEELTMKG